MRRYLIDENISKIYCSQLLYHEPSLTVLMVGDDAAPKKGTSDQNILLWCEQNNFTLVTKDRKSMRPHLDNHLSKGHHIPGIFTINPKTSMGAVLEDLIYIAKVSDEKEFLDDIIFIPL